MRALAMLSVVVSIVAATAARTDYLADYDAAAADGYEAVQWSTAYDEMAAWLDREIVSNWMADRAPGVAYSISCASADLNADGFGDAIVSIGTTADLVPDGSPVLVIYKLGAGWLLVDESHAVDVAVNDEGVVAYLDADGSGYRLMED